MISTLISILVVAAIAWLCFWAIDSVGAPSPINIIAKAIIAVLAVIAFLNYM